ncbi:ABC transporter ATP-binding protein [Salinibacter ruber]|uniref:ABC transporter ATP-binding protein n=1 Tax=Salinibacter ruber TaxID=146919 RepID=UPI002169DBD1|nr:ATP-binding cassette domain-containing protein [Salinibacter ruber]MCS4196752.1 phospholipid/cholesterol/gamma-HCH transport system ATP-binding protein [Salinibacter ruber]
MSPPESAPAISAEDLVLAFGSFVVMEDLTFDVESGEIFAIMGGSGSGKSTLLKHLLGQMHPSAGTIRIGGRDLWAMSADERAAMLREVGILYQADALWSTMTLAENVALPLEEHTALAAPDIDRIVSLKLALVGLRGFEDFRPHEISGGMRKRAALARAVALDPDLLFFDEPTSGLDPISARRLDDLILQLRDSLDTTVVVVSHDLESIFTIADRALYLDIDTKTMTALGPPEDLRSNPPNERVYQFLTRSLDNE